ncbi:hypothetical protein AMTRI_Chr06g172730 [Amborella trichopoda]
MDKAIHSCSRCYRPQILKEHIIAGLFTYHHLSKLANGTKIQTKSSDRSITVPSMNSTHNTIMTLINGIQITRLDGFIFPFPQSCFSPKNTPRWMGNATHTPENYTTTMPLSPENTTNAEKMTPKYGSMREIEGQEQEMGLAWFWKIPNNCPVFRTRDSKFTQV